MCTVDSTMQDDDFKALGIDRNPATYRMLNDSKCLTVAGHDDKKEFGIVVNAMQVLGFAHDTQQAIWRTLAGILLLGNLEFAPLSAKDSEASRVSNPELVAQIAALWDVVPANLDGALVTRTFAMRSPRRCIRACLTLWSSSSTGAWRHRRS